MDQQVPVRIGLRRSGVNRDEDFLETTVWVNGHGYGATPPDQSRTLHVELDLDLDIGAMKDEVARVRPETREAAEVQAQAARHTRKVVRALRAEGYTMDDAAGILGVSKGRTSQLVTS